ncbi:MAG: sugar phosphate nucleotidyltransferase [Reichenbachiella sp.]
MKPTLLILAAGRGSRFGGAKQVAPMGPHGETIMEYSIYDALESGFGNVVLVINKEVEKDTFELVNKMSVKENISYAYQDLHNSMIPTNIIEARTKPWGTAHAIMSAEDEISGSFAMINADDYYGKDGFKTMADFLIQHNKSSDYSMIGYELKNTLSENGTVSRGISISDENNKLATIKETHGIHDQEGTIVGLDDDKNEIAITKGLASMNFWGFQNNLFEELNTQFQKFLKSDVDLSKDEFVIPAVIDSMIKTKKIEVSVLKCSAKWFGVTYKEDQAFAAKAIQANVKSGQYPSPLWK